MSRVCMNVVLLFRLILVLEVLGFLVIVDGVVDGNSYYFCFKMGVNYSGEVCECCKFFVDVDVVVVYLYWFFVKILLGSGYECMLRILCFFKKYMLEIVELFFCFLC